MVKKVVRWGISLFILLIPITIYAILTPAGTIIINGGDNGTSTYQDGITQSGDVLLNYKGIFIKAPITSNTSPTK